jgi:hypothetical protein
MFRQLGLCSSDALVGDELVTAEGNLRLRQRRFIQAASHRERAAAHAETMVALEGR